MVAAAMVVVMVAGVMEDMVRVAARLRTMPTDLQFCARS